MVSESLFVLVLAACVLHLSATGRDEKPQTTLYLQTSTFQTQCQKLECFFPDNMRKCIHKWVEHGATKKETFLIGDFDKTNRGYILEYENETKMQGRTLTFEDVNYAIDDDHYTPDHLTRLTFQNNGKIDKACAIGTIEPDEKERRILKASCHKDGMKDVECPTA